MTSPTSQGELTRVSIVIPFRNARATLGKCLEHVKKASTNDVEILLIDDASEDGSSQIAREQTQNDGRTYLIRQPKVSGAAACRNLGVAHARGALVFFLDADCFPESDWIASALVHFEKETVVGVEGPVFYAEANPCLSDKIPINPLYNLKRVRPINDPSEDYAAGNIAFRRSAFQAVGGFDTATFALGREDTDLALRVGEIGTIVFEKRMKVIHDRSRWTLKELLENARRYRDDVAFYSRHRHFKYRWGRILHPWLLLMLLVPPTIIFWGLPYVRSLSDMRYFVPLYLYVLVGRIHIWLAAWRLKIFVL